MRNRSVLVIGIAVMLITSACSTSSDGPAKSKPTSAADPANANTNSSIANGTRIDQPQPTDANLAPGGVPDQLATAANRLDGRIAAMRKAGEPGSDLDAEKVALKNAKPAPDNSTFTSYLTDAGYEIRTFKNHPQLLKVQKRTAPDGSQSLKVFLRDGKVVELPGQRITVLATATAAYILEAAGVDPIQQQQTGRPAPATKKAG